MPIWSSRTLSYLCELMRWARFDQPQNSRQQLEMKRSRCRFQPSMFLTQTQSTNNNIASKAGSFKVQRIEFFERSQEWHKWNLADFAGCFVFFYAFNHHIFLLVRCLTLIFLTYFGSIGLFHLIAAPQRRPGSSEMVSGPRCCTGTMVPCSSAQALFKSDRQMSFWIISA